MATEEHIGMSVEGVKRVQKSKGPMPLFSVSVCISVNQMHDKNKLRVGAITWVSCFQRCPPKQGQLLCSGY